MKTGNRTITLALALPDTHFLLEFVRPDLLGLRVVSRALILWDDVQPTREWMDKQIPWRMVVKNAYAEMRDIARKAMEGRTCRIRGLPSPPPQFAESLPSWLFRPKQNKPLNPGFKEAPIVLLSWFFNLAA
jgi:hypothetical protein